MHLVDFERLLMKGINPLGNARKPPSVITMLKPAGRLTANDCLAVYRNNITSTRVRALQAIYPVCEVILGSHCFRALARQYAWQAADDCANLNTYGEQFAEYINSQQREEFQQLPYLKEMALLEWHWHAAYYAAESAPFNYESFALHAAYPQRLQFVLADSLALMETHYPVREVWQRHRAEENPHCVAALERSEYLCIHRPAYEPRLMCLDKAMYILLTSIKNGSTLAQLADLADLADSLAETLPALIRQGWVSDFLMKDTVE